MTLFTNERGVTCLYIYKEIWESINIGSALAVLAASQRHQCSCHKTNLLQYETEQFALIAYCITETLPSYDKYILVFDHLPT